LPLVEGANISLPNHGPWHGDLMHRQQCTLLIFTFQVLGIVLGH
jgi:hypothetical protein